MKKLTILVLVIGFIALLYGCCSHSSDGISIIPSGDTVLTSREVIIDELGRLPTVTFPSGAKIEGLEDNTLTPGIVVTIIEQKMTGKNTAYFNASNDTGMYIYKITAFMNPTNSFGAKTYVTTTEKPVKITLPRLQNSQGIILAGIKESNTDPWRLFNYSDSDEILADIAGVRAAGTNIKDNTFNLFRLGTQFALVSYESNSGNRLPETYVTALNASSTPSILVKDGKYLEDLTIKGIIKGVKLDSIKPTDLRARITYRNNVADEAPIKVNGVNITQTSKADKTIPGYSYCHSFLIDSVSESNLMGNSGEFAFTLDLDGIETQSFSNGFLIEFFNKVNSEKILPYNYTEFYTVKQVGVYNIVYDLDGGSVDTANPTTYSEASSTFTLTNPTKTGYTFIGWSGTGLTGNNNLTVTIEQGSTGDRTYTANWSENPPDAYTLVLNKGAGVATVTGGGSYMAGVEVTATCTMLAGYEFANWLGDFSTGTFTMPENDVSMTANSRPISYTISYNLDGGTENTNPTAYDITSATITLISPTKDHHMFVGWTGSNGNTPQTTVTIEQGTTGDKAYTAHWSEVAYVITYNLDGGEVATANPTDYNTASETFVLIEPTKVGYTFTGWTGSNGNTPQTTVTIEQGSTGDKEFTANWSVNSYRLDIIAGTGINTVTGDGMHEYDSSVTASCTMLDGYEFANWSGDLTTETFNMPANNATMTANAKLINYTITYNLDGGTVATPNPTSYDVTSATINLNEPTKVGYTFLGWTGSNGDVPQKPLSIPQGSTSDLSFTAHWSINSYRLDLIAGTGIATVTGANTYEYGTEVTASCTMLAGYQFDKWTGDITSETFNMPASNATMTANAKLINYTITYDLDGGTLAEGDSNPEYYNITSSTITLNNPIKAGTYFMGWTSDEYFGASMSVKIPQGSMGNKSYTANWGEMLTFTLPNGVTLVMHKIPAGVFTMGSPTDELGRQSYETQHQVTLTKAFYIGRFEVTQDQYFAVMGTNPSNFKGGAAASARPTTSANYPVELVSYTTARTFCASLTTYLAGHIPTGFSSFDLPTEAQWEYACRAGTTTALNNNKNLINASALDSNLSEVAWYSQNWGQSNSKTHTVGEKLPNAWGLYDMHGNVWEWCLDRYGDYPTTAVVDPAGAGSGFNRVYRGGSWIYSPSYCRSAYRYVSNPSDTNSHLGFRLVLVPAP